MGDVRVGARVIGDGQPCFIIAEAGSNHNGSLDMALELIDVAAKAGVDAVKFQTFRASKLYTRAAGASDYLGDSRPIYDIIEAMEMPREWIPRLAAHCSDHGVEFLSSPFDEESADLLEPYVNAYKIASYELTHEPLVRHVARKGKPILLSTGASDLEEVVAATNVIREEGNRDIVLFQCTASYPTPPDAVNASAIVTIREALGLPTGLSDHSRDPIVAPVVAVALGACAIEKHYTLSNDLPGPDHRFAVEPDELAEMVRCVRGAEKVLGDGLKQVLAAEEELHAFARRGVYATRDIGAREQFTEQNVAVLRRGKAGAGMPPSGFQDLLGRRAAREIAADSPVTEEDVE